MGDDRASVSAELVARLVAEQFPQWADLPVTPVIESGWDNHTFRLGSTMKVRLPSASRYVAQVEKENRFLPLLAPHLPLPVPVPLGVGTPGPGFDWPWSIYGWINGNTLSQERLADMARFGTEMARFLKALQAIDTNGAPPAGAQNFHRGGSLGFYDADTRDYIVGLGDRIDQAAAFALWEKALASRWPHDPVWIHGDIAVGNLLVSGGALSAVIDFGGCAIGDPACDLVIAWLFMDETARSAFRQGLGLDDATWARARGWAMWKALFLLSRNQPTHPAEVPPLEVIARVIAEHQSIA